jgi:ClpP class serine protease
MTTLHPLAAPVLLPFPGDEVMAMDPSTLQRLWSVQPRHATATLTASTTAEDGAPRADYDDEDDEGCDDGNIYLEGGVAVVSVDGPLLQRGGWWWDGYASIHQRFQSALTRPGTRTLVLKLNSPGGVAAGCFEAARQMRADARAAGIPVLVYADEMACSAAYALACIGDQIWLPPSGALGSIGVIATYLDASAALKDMGLRYVLLTSGAYKADGHSAQPITPEMVARLRVPTDHLAALFFAWVAERRGLDVPAVAALQAGVLWGRTAVAAGLADRVGTLPECLATAAALAAAPNPTLALALAERSPLRAAASAPEIPMSDTSTAEALALPAEPAAPAPETVLKADHDTMVAALSASLSAAEARVSALAADNDRLTAEVSAVRGALADAEGKVKAAESARITAKVEAFVGQKLTPAEREDYLAIALENEARFDGLMKNRPDLALTDKRIVADTGNEARVTDGEDGNITKLNKLAAAYQAAHPGTAPHVALAEVMRQRPDLCASAT